MILLAFQSLYSIHLKILKVCVSYVLKKFMSLYLYTASSVPFVEDRGGVLVPLANEIQFKPSIVSNILPIECFYTFPRISNLWATNSIYMQKWKMH